MHRKMVFFGLLLAALAAASPAWAKIQVSAQVDRTTISTGESLQLVVRVSGGQGEVDLSPLTDFKVHSQSTSTNVQIINGRMTREVAYNYVLIHLNKGELTIPPLTVNVDGRPHRTEPITVTVTDGPPTGQPDSARGKDVWVTSEISENSPYIGQQITYMIRFYQAVNIDDARFQQVPSFKGFSSKKIEDRKAYRKIMNGREVAVTEVFFVLTPLEEGTLTIEPAILHVGVIVQNARRGRSPFDSFFNRHIVEPRMLQTEPMEIAVRPLPPLTSAREFSGLVGRFEMTAEIESTDLKTGDSATLTITLQGKGNIMDAQSPKVELPKAFKSYTDNPHEEINLSPAGTDGKKVFRTALVPVDPGEYTFPSIELVYFDVEKEDYRILEAEVPTLKVRPAPNQQSVPLTVTPGPLPSLKKRVAFTGRDILPPKESIDAITPQSPMGWPLFLIALVAPALVYGCAELVQHRRRPQTSASAIMRTKAHKSLKNASSETGQDFLSFLYQALTAAILGAAGRTGEALTWKEAKSILLENKFSREDADQAAKLLSDIESSKFSGARLETDQKKALLVKTRKVVRKLTP